MPGRSITAQQQELYMTERNRGATQVCAATKAGISERSGRTLENDACWRPAGRRAGRTYRTRLDPFSGVWEREIVPQLTESPTLQATTLLGDLQERHPGRFRTLCCGRCSAGSVSGARTMVPSAR